MEEDGSEKNLSICSLGGSVATAPEGLSAEVVEVQNFEDLAELGEAGIKGKIVFYNRPMDPTQIKTFHAYGGAVEQTGTGSFQSC